MFFFVISNIFCNFTEITLSMAELDDTFTCDECECKFRITDGGFIGSLDDFEFRKTKGDIDTEVEHIECSPFMSYVQLCKDCYSKKD